MKQFSLSNVLKRAAALTLAISLSIPAAFASAGEIRLQTKQTILDGLTYSNTITQQATRRNESFSLLVQPENGITPILLQSSGTAYAAATINRAVSRAQELGYHVLGAINTDYFSTATGVPMGIVIEDHIYKSSATNRPAILIEDGVVTYSATPTVQLTLTNQTNHQEFSIPHLNKYRTATGGLYLLNRDFSTISTRTSTSGWFVRMKQIPNNRGLMESLSVNSSFTLEVTEVLQSDGAISIEEGEYILTADDKDKLDSVFQSFQVGDRITLTTTCEDKVLSNAQWAGGVGDLMIENGSITDSSSWLHNDGARAPRSALGVMPDGSLFLYAIDGRQSGYSSGLTQMELANELLEQGCVWAVNLDGGGSTSLSVWVPGQSGPAIQNLPSDGKPRGGATYLLLVSEESGNGRPHQLTMPQGMVVLTGSSLTLPEAVVIDNGLNVLKETVTDLTISSTTGLGHITDGIYTAGNTAGTEVLRLSSHQLGIEGSVTIHVVDTLTELTITEKGKTTPLTSLNLNPEETISLTAAGSFWNRPAMRDVYAITWDIEPTVGTMDANGTFTGGIPGSSGDLTVTVGGLSQTIPVTIKNIHTDVTKEHWAYNAVEYCYENGIVGGISSTEFGRDLPIRRGDFMLMLYSALGKPAVSTPCTFTDVSESDYYYTALAWGQQVGLASGTGNGAYSPKNPLTREQAFTILRQVLPLLNKQCPDGDLSILAQFNDADCIADYAKPHAATLVAQGVVSGKGDGLDPKGNLTRAEMAALVCKILTYTPILEYPNTPELPEQPDAPEAPETPDTPTTPDIPTVPETPDSPQPPIEPDIPSTSEPEAPEIPQGASLTLSQPLLILNSGESATLTATLSPHVKDAVITWSSSSPTTATVTPAGVVTNLFPGVGTPSVIVTATCGSLSAQCVVVCNSASRTGTVTDAQGGLNVRSGPGTEHGVIGRLANNTQVVVLGEQNGWYQVLYCNKDLMAAIGYVSGTYLKITSTN